MKNHPEKPDVNFLFLPAKNTDYSSSRFVIIPVPYEATTTFKSGTKHGPAAIINASIGIETFDEETSLELSETGISTLKEIESHAGGPEQMMKRITGCCDSVLSDEKILGMLGGEHSITLGAVRSLNKKYGNFSVLQFDAHADLRDSYESTPYSHACVMRRVYEETDGRIVQAGIRSYSSEENDFIAKKGLNLLSMREIREKDNWIQELESRLEKKVYITIDLDCLDPSVMPAVGTPEPGGLLCCELLDALSQTAEKHEIIGFDVVELSPIAGLVYPDVTAARIVSKMIAYIYRSVLK